MQARQWSGKFSVLKKSVFFILFSVVLNFGCATRGHQMTRNLVAGNEAALQGDYEAAIQNYEVALNDVPNAMIAKRNLGIVLVKVGQYKRARTVLESILNRYARDVEVRYFLGEASRGLGQFAVAKSHYQAALNLDPRDLRVIKAYAWTHNKLSHFDKALDIIEPLLSSHSDDLQLRLVAGNAYNKQRRYKNTLQILEVVERANFRVQSRDQSSADSERVLLQVTLADAYLGLENCEKALGIYQDVLRTRPFLSNALTGVAKCDLKNNDISKAVAKLERAAKADPETPEPYYLMAKALEKTDSKKSIGLYRKFLMMAKESREYAFEMEQSRSALQRLN